MNLSRSVVVRFTPHQIECLSKIAIYLKTDISSIIRLCVNDGIETFLHWSGTNILEPQLKHENLDNNVI